MTGKFTVPDYTKVRHRDHWVGLVITGIVFLVYLATLAPDLTFEHEGSDGGDLITAAYTLGVPHPPGYPTYTILAWLFTHLPFGTIAYRVNLLSAVCAALAIYFFFRITWELQPEADRTLIIPIASTTILAFSSLYWSQAVIAEVYALLALFSTLLLWLLIRWRNGAQDWYLWLGGLFFGIGLGNHLSLVFILPASLILLWSERRRWFRLRVLLPAFLLFLVGISVFMYLPIAAAHDPPVNWGNPQTWDGFVWVVTARPYQSFVFGLPSENISTRLGTWGLLFIEQFWWWGLIIAGIGIIAWFIRDRTFLFFSVVWGVPLAIFAFAFQPSDSFMFLIPVFILLAICWGEGVRLLMLIGGQLTARTADTSPNPTISAFWRWWPRIIVLLLPIALMTSNWNKINLSKDVSAPTYISEILNALPEGSVVLTRCDKPTFSLWYELYVNQNRTDLLVVNGRLLSYDWYRQQISSRYPELNLPIVYQETDSDDYISEFITLNLNNHSMFATDPSLEWENRFNFTDLGESPVYRISPKVE